MTGPQDAVARPPYRLICYTRSERGARESPSPDECHARPISENKPAAWMAAILRRLCAAVLGRSYEKAPELVDATAELEIAQCKGTSSEPEARRAFLLRYIR
jgi:hypothetical protein